ncbi:MAG: hypothetical protein QM586_02400 [Xenophilus sp.]
MDAYFDLQLSFAERYAGAARVSFGVAVERCTNLRRRLGLEGHAGAGGWQRFLVRIEELAGNRPAVLALCLACFDGRPRHALERAFGCFSYDPPDAQGAMRIHFMPPEGVPASPLAATGMDARRAELRALFAHVRRCERRALCVRGLSWLYNLDAYRRLFPPAYCASIRAPGFSPRLNGTSTWGQVLDWRQQVKPRVRDAVLVNLAGLRPSAPWEVFPFRALMATCSIDRFHDWFA